MGIKFVVGPKIATAKIDSNLVSNPRRAGAGRDTVLIEKLH